MTHQDTVTHSHQRSLFNEFITIYLLRMTVQIAHIVNQVFLIKPLNCSCKKEQTQKNSHLLIFQNYFLTLGHASEILVSFKKQLSVRYHFNAFNSGFHIALYPDKLSQRLVVEYNFIIYGQAPLFK